MAAMLGNEQTLLLVVHAGEIPLEKRIVNNNLRRPE